MNKNDILILISSSGTSNNIVIAKYCNDNNIPLITLSGFDINNPLTKLGNINIHIPSKI